MFLIVQGNGDRDVRIAFDVPAGATIHWSGVGFDFGWAGLDENTAIVKHFYRTGSAFTDFGTSLSLPSVVRVRGVVINAATPGNVTLQWSQRSNGVAPISMLAGSFLRAGKFE